MGWSVGRRTGVAAVVAAYGLLVVGWTFSNPLFAAPDEPASVVKAVGTAYGDLTGSPHGPIEFIGNTRATAWYERAVRRFEIPERYARIDPKPCYAFAMQSAGCERRPLPTGDRLVPAETQQGTYVPALYAPAGLALRAAPTVDTGVRTGRLVTGAIAVVLLALATWLASYGTTKQVATRLATLALATTPMLLFLSASISTNGVEAAAAVCAWSAALRLADNTDPTARRRAWAFLAVGGTVLALSRLLDPAFIVVIALVTAILAGRSPVPRSLRAKVATAVVAVACLGTALWDSVVVPSPFLAGPVMHTGVLNDALSPGAMTDVGKQAVGMFGWTNRAMPPEPYVAWGVAVLLLLVAALALGTHRQRAAVVTLLMATYGAYVAIAAVEANLGFRMQARYVAALLVGIPLVAGEVVARHADRIPYVRAAAGALVATTALTHVTAIAVNQRLYTFTLVPYDSTIYATWRPPGGPIVWVVTAFVAASLLVTGAVAASTDR